MSENVVTEALVNKKTGEVLEIGLQKSPDEIMVDASEAAKALERVISSNKRKLMEFNGKRYLEFPHWQTIGRFFHTTVSTDGAEFVTLQGATATAETIRGFKATAKVIDEKTGVVVGSAEAYCMTDEPNWKHKPLFQLASMAQTRAASKALSNKYRYVAILAGYEPTPAEETNMVAETGLRGPKEVLIEPEIPFGDGPILPPAAREGAGEPLITDKQRKMLFARSRAMGITEDAIKSYLWDEFGLVHTKDLNRSQFKDVLEWVDTWVATPNAQV